MFGASQEILPFDGSAVYFPNFIDNLTSRRAFAELLEQTKWESPEYVMFGKKIIQPGMSAWFCDNGLPYKYSGVERVAHRLTPLLGELKDLCSQKSGAEYNSVLAILYRDGNDSVSWHSDNEATNGIEPTIASLSFGATRRFDLRHKQTKQTVRVDLEDGSLLVMAGLSQHCWVHQIAKTKTKVGPRINLTFRLVGRSS